MVIEEVILNEKGKKLKCYLVYLNFEKSENIQNVRI